MKSLESHLAESVWMQGLEPELADLVKSRAIEKRVDAGGYVHYRGMKPEYFIGVIDGLLFMSRNSELGFNTAIATAHPGDWIGEASLLFLKQRQFDLVAIRPSRLACIPRAVCKRMYDTSIPFSHYIAMKLAKRMGAFAKLLSSDRMLKPASRVAFCLMGFVSAQRVQSGGRIEITQIETGQLTGLSRQYVNSALHDLQAANLISIERGAVRIIDVDALARLIS